MYLKMRKPDKRALGVILKLFLAIFILIIFSPTLVWAQKPVVEPQIVTAVAETQCGDQVLPITIEVWNVGATGGDGYAQATLSGYDCINDKPSNVLKTMHGTFTGGPNGFISFDMCTPNNCVTVNFQFLEGKQILYEGAVTGYVIQNPEAFDGWRTEPITSEYIYNTYGIRVQDSFGDDQWEQKSWSDQELILLNDVLKELPPSLLSKLAVTRIIRNKVYIDGNGNQDPNTFGVYHPCGSPPETDCSSSSGTIRIFDMATRPFDFSNDPDGIKEFKGTILHELIHALQYKKDEYSIYKNPYSSPIMQNYMDAARPITNINDPGFEGNNGWTYGKHPPGQPFQSWKLFSTQNSNPPTNYGGKNPLEDMSESVMMYVYEPQKLQSSSPQRYTFIRDQIFEGVEYENGTQKKP